MCRRLLLPITSTWKSGHALRVQVPDRAEEEIEVAPFSGGAPRP